MTNKGASRPRRFWRKLLPKEIASIYWPKNMYWRAGKPERFVRPVRWIVAMLDGEVIPLEFAGIKAGQFIPWASHSWAGTGKSMSIPDRSMLRLCRNAHVMVA